MRVTNKIIQNNALTNINVNKVLQDKLSTMISTEKKIARPSEDPIVALRSLRLRTSVNQTEQYVEKNVEDAKSWLTVTEDAISTLSDIITDIRKQYVKGSSDTLEPSDRKIILDNLSALAAEVYNTGNADFAGRSVFTGFRTESTLTFQKQQDTKYEITETEASLIPDTVRYIHTDDSEYNVYQADIRRIRLSYSDLDDADLGMVKINGADLTADVVKMSSTASPDPYSYVHDNPGKVVYIPETGEVLLGDTAVTGDITSIEVTYQKSKWSKGDLRPEHYFNCKDLTNNIDYTSHDGEIEYNIGVNQFLRINTNAGECFTHNISRDMDDAINALREQMDIDDKIAKLTAELKSLPGTDTVGIALTQKQLDAAKKAKTFIDDKLTKLMGSNITHSDGYLNRNSVALTNCGTRSKRLDLIENRLDTQLASLKELKSENEDADLAETAIKLSSAQYAYDASLMSTSKIIKESLLNYI